MLYVSNFLEIKNKRKEKKPDTCYGYTLVRDKKVNNHLKVP